MMKEGNIVRGRIVVIPSGRGVASLIVEAYDVTPDPSRAAASAGPDALKGARRLGSAETNEKGEFSIEYPPPVPTARASLQS